MGGRGSGTIVIITTGSWNFGLLAWNRLARRWRLHCEFDRWLGRLALVATHWSRPRWRSSFVGASEGVGASAAHQLQFS